MLSKDKFTGAIGSGATARRAWACGSSYYYSRASLTSVSFPCVLPAVPVFDVPLPACVVVVSGPNPDRQYRTPKPLAYALILPSLAISRVSTLHTWLFYAFPESLSQYIDVSRQSRVISEGSRIPPLSSAALNPYTRRLLQIRGQNNDWRTGRGSKDSYLDGTGLCALLMATGEDRRYI